MGYELVILSFRRFDPAVFNVDLKKLLLPLLQTCDHVTLFLENLEKLTATELLAQTQTLHQTSEAETKNFLSFVTNLCPYLPHTSIPTDEYTFAQNLIQRLKNNPVHELLKLSTKELKILLLLLLYPKQRYTAINDINNFYSSKILTDIMVLSCHYGTNLNVIAPSIDLNNLHALCANKKLILILDESKLAQTMLSLRQINLQPSACSVIYSNNCFRKLLRDPQIKKNNQEFSALQKKYIVPIVPGASYYNVSYQQALNRLYERHTHLDRSNMFTVAYRKFSTYTPFRLTSTITDANQVIKKLGHILKK